MEQSYKNLKYNAQDAIDYARAWANRRNPKYLDFTGIGGDCTNFVSQCLYAGSRVMNEKANSGWYYNSSTDRSAPWTGVPYLYKFLTTNEGLGPYGKEVSLSEIVPGDIVQIADAERGYHHSMLILEVGPTYDDIYIVAHSDDALDRQLSSYDFTEVRFIHIDGVRTVL